MAPEWFNSVVLVSLLLLYSAQGNNENIASARVESCRGCRLNRLPEVKQFIFEDVPLFENVEFKHIQGASPELVVLNAQDEELERIDLAPLSRKDCNDLLIKRGFHKKTLDDELLDAQHEEF